MADRKFFHPIDLVPAAILFFCGVIPFLFHAKQRPGEVIVLHHGSADVMRLEPDRIFDISGPYPLRLRFENNTVRVEKSSCPAGICRHHGSISRPGEVIICLPNRVSVKITGSSIVDTITE
ncbi:MAG: NusG domain II-containing protein [Candidatus Wallbacteria bacterium]|nr:NusG domain II-containing protein [Candidatus Wallbacteria bacterium]